MNEVYDSAEYESLAKFSEDWEDAPEEDWLNGGVVSSLVFLAYEPVHESAIKAVRSELLDSIKYYDGYGSVEL